jgi:hypothetical protein
MRSCFGNGQLLCFSLCYDSQAPEIEVPVPVFREHADRVLDRTAAIKRMEIFGVLAKTPMSEIYFSREIS